MTSLCSLCSAEYTPPLNRPTWAKCIPCTLGGTHTALHRKGPAPAYPLPPATPDRVTFIVPGPPMSVNRVHGLAFRNGKRVMYFTEAGRRYKLSVASHALAAIGRIHWDKSRKYRLSLLSYFDNPRSDSDNPLKVLKDALQGVLYLNDNQVISDHTEKAIDKVAPRMVVTVEAIE